MTEQTKNVTFKKLTSRDLTATSLILSVLSACEAKTLPTRLIDGRTTLSVAEIVAAASLFEIDASAVRMALTRLARDGRVRSEKRAFYALGPQAQTVNVYISNWRAAAALLRPWDGAWWVLLSGHLGRTDRKALRNQHRALDLFGYAQAEKGVWVRPANLHLTLDDLRAALNQMGLCGDEIHLSTQQTIVGPDRAWTTLWSAQWFEDGYRAALTTLKQSRAQLDGLALADAARESFLVGQSLIRCIGRDPLLPDDLVDSDLFKQMHAQMIAYDETGRRIWRAFLSEHARREERQT